MDTLEEELLSIAQSLQPKEPPKLPEEPEGDGWLEVGKKNKAVATRTVSSICLAFPNVFLVDAPYHQTKSTESPITRIFGGKFRSTLRTPHQRESVTIEDWRSLQLDIQPENVESLRDALQHISHPQNVQISIPTRPGALLDAQQQVLIDALPPVLILHMKRFLYDTKVGDVVKVGKQVSFASELDIPSGTLLIQSDLNMMPNPRRRLFRHHLGNKTNGTVGKIRAIRRYVRIQIYATSKTPVLQTAIR